MNQACDEIRAAIELLYDLPAYARPDDAEETFVRFREALGMGLVRAAAPDADGWRVNGWVKKGIIVGFRIGVSKRTLDGGLRRSAACSNPSGRCP